GLGFLGLLTIGFPIVIGAVLCLVAGLAPGPMQPGGRDHSALA
ncbi:MAG: hypothetical protein QOK15_2190, partial [Nocardioidaceae bacterium]|nr:hypothetical protein [Nocardioidaceae bacterium]